jgi:hypothetical protein
MVGGGAKCEALSYYELRMSCMRRPAAAAREVRSAPSCRLFLVVMVMVMGMTSCFLLSWKLLGGDLHHVGLSTSIDTREIQPCLGGKYFAS